MENFDPFKNKKVDFITYLKRCHHYILKHYDFESFIVCPYLGLLLTIHLLYLQTSYYLLHFIAYFKAFFACFANYIS